MPENDTSVDTDKKRLEDMGLADCEGDNDYVEKILEKINKKFPQDLKDVKVASITRLPERKASRRGDQANKPRLMQVKFESENDKWAVLSKAGKVFGKDEAWANVYLSLDRTAKERAADFALREERRRREQAGETNLVIRNGKVVPRNDSQPSRSSSTPSQQGRGEAGLGAGGRI